MFPKKADQKHISRKFSKYNYGVLFLIRNYEKRSSAVYQQWKCM